MIPWFRKFRPPKRRFSWKQPKEFSRIVEGIQTKYRVWWLQPAAALSIALLLIIQWWIARLNPDPDKKPPSIATALGLAAFGGVLFAYFLPWLVGKFPTYIAVYDNGISKSQGNHTRWWKFDVITECEWLTKSGFTTMILKLKTGKEVFIGVPGSVVVEPIQEFIKKQISTRTSVTPR